jgi:hypothetical protein
MTEATKRGRGRPKGSRNKPKPIIWQPPPDPPPTAEATGSVAGHGNTAPVDVGSGGTLLDKYRAIAARTEAALDRASADPASLPKDITSLTSTLNRTYWHIGQLTGEAQLTETKIVRSDAWKNVLTRIEAVLAKHPEAAAELAAYFESLEST